MNVKCLVLAAALLGSSTIAFAASPEPAPRWLVGYWSQTYNEDGPAGGDTFEFRADGSFVGYARDCRSLPVDRFHMHQGNVYVTRSIPGKGPISVLFVPSADHKRLTFTSPRTGNNAAYSPVAGCVPVGR